MRRPYFPVYTSNPLHKLSPAASPTFLIAILKHNLFLLFRITYSYSQQFRAYFICFLVVYTFPSALPVHTRRPYFSADNSRPYASLIFLCQRFPSIVKTSPATSPPSLIPLIAILKHSLFLLFRITYSYLQQFKPNSLYIMTAFSLNPQYLI